MSVPLPHELVDAIVGYLSDDVRTLESCALVARTWSGPSQRALFHHIDLTYYLVIEGFLAHLTRHPHLRLLIRCVSLAEFPLESDKVDVVQYSICVAALLRCLPFLTSVIVTYSIAWIYPHVDGSFPQVLAGFLRQSSLTTIDIHGLYTPYNFQQALSSLEGSRIKRVCLTSVDVQRPTQIFIEEAVRLPCVEFLRLDVASRYFDTFEFWFSKPQTTFPCLKHCEISAGDLTEMTRWLTWFRQSMLKLDSLRIESKTSHGYIAGQTTESLSAFHGLHCTHLQLCIADRARQPWPVIWWTNAFKSLVDSGARIHFTELTFTFPHVEALSDVWNDLDGVLSHNAFGGVQKIHFEKNSEDRTLITDLVHPEFASSIQRVMPGLASRGVLRLS